MTGPVDYEQLEADLQAAGVGRTMASAIAGEFDVRTNRTLAADPAGAHAQAAAILALAQAGLVGGALWELSQAGVSVDAATLHARGVSLNAIDQIASASSLSDAIVALDAGARVSWIEHVGAGGHLSAWQLVELTQRGLTDSLFDQISRSGGEWARVRSILEKGGTWEDVTTLLTAVSPSIALGHYVNLLEDTPPSLAGIPRRVQVLACVLAASSLEPTPREVMPLAAALIDQPWQSTALTLIADQPAGPPKPVGHPAILAARALENDLTLPVTTESTPPWAPPPVLDAAAALSGGTPAEVLAAAGVDPDTITQTLRWLGPRADELRRTSVDLDLSAWNITCLDTLAVALARGVTLTDVRLATSITVSHAASLGVENAALVLACGVSLETAEQWAADGFDVPTTAMLSSYGVDAQTLELIRTLDAERPLEAERAWQAVSLLAGGVPVDKLPVLLPVFADAPTASMWAHLANHTRMPVSTSMLEALAGAGLTLRKAAHLWRSSRVGDVTLPDAATELAIRLTAQLLDEEADRPLPVAVLAYAAAAAGQPWAAQAVIDTSTTDPWHSLTGQVLAARGITPASRTITRAPALRPERRSSAADDRMSVL